jgi:hypothetical protein
MDSVRLPHPRRPARPLARPLSLSLSLSPLRAVRLCTRLSLSLSLCLCLCLCLCLSRLPRCDAAAAPALLPLLTWGTCAGACQHQGLACNRTAMQAMARDM